MAEGKTARVTRLIILLKSDCHDSVSLSAPSLIIALSLSPPRPAPPRPAVTGPGGIVGSYNEGIVPFTSRLTGGGIDLVKRLALLR